MAWSSAAAGRATARAARRCPRAPGAMICGAPTSRASSGSATDGIVTRRPSPTMPRASCCCAKRWGRPAKIPPARPSNGSSASALPLAIRSDNGGPFASPNALFNLSRLSVWWLRLGIAVERIKPGHPQQNGRHERMHLTLKKETTQPPGSNSLQQQERFDAFAREFNAERPHEALDMKCPAELYLASSRPYDGLPELIYPFHDREVLVTACGPALPASQADQHLNRAGRPETRDQGSRRRHLACQLHAQ
jgi:Integrase core domain